MGLLTVPELRALVDHPAGDDADEALQQLLDEAEEAIVGRYGTLEDITEIRNASGTYLTLSSAASAVATVTEWSGSASTELDEDDWRLLPDGRHIERLRTGTNPVVGGWWGRVEVAYTPLDDANDRRRVQRGLVELELNHRAGLTSERIGDWEQSFGQNSVYNYGIERESILASLGQAPAWDFA